ncbi:hypothetical protein NDU88_001727 [Pleurodeles waltl]|uniref:Uncharacterized protein n=1 Tax=Pleurodeles waltl TaxID=8319 RepID=A0AAV7WJA5_PLEWA|nr:hypothetical protein NDU88_001727 [Pleurodeles waltl]
MCSVTPTTRKHSHSRGVRRCCRKPQRGSPARLYHAVAEQGRNGTRGTATSSIEDDDAPLSHAKEERRVYVALRKTDLSIRVSQS